MVTEHILTIPDKCLENEDLHSKWLDYLSRLFGVIQSITQKGKELTIVFNK